MFVEDCGGDACGSHVFHLHFPVAVVVKLGANYKAFDAMFGKCALKLWFVLDNGFHADKEEGSGVIVVLAVQTGEGAHFGVYYILA